MQENVRAAHLVQFWRTVEMFGPQNIPQLTSPRAIERADYLVCDVEPGEPAPWEPEHPLARARLARDKTWQFVVYGALYDLSAVHAELSEQFGKEAVPEERRKDGKTAVYAFSVDAEGTLIEDSPVLSACAWAISRLGSPGPRDPKWLDGFDEESSSFGEELNRLSPKKKPGGKLGKFGTAVTGQVKEAAQEAATAGAKATGSAVKTAVVAGATSLTGPVVGPVVGGIAGATAGAFAERLLTPASAKKPADETASGRESRVELTSRTLHAFTRELVTALGLDDSLRAAGIRVRCYQISRRNAGKADDQDFLNSPVAEDLGLVEKEIRAGRRGEALRAFLGEDPSVPASDRVDLRAQPGALLSGVEPAVIPGGRWPSAYPLVTGQQFAVDWIMARPDAGLFAVNGPPGTGKTTMLRDVLAGIVVERARRLSRLDTPSEAYTERQEAVRPYSSQVRALRPELTGFEIVVATASNDAAANITQEMPALTAVKGVEDEAVAVDYFTELGSHVLGKPAWGLVAAMLGKMQHRRDFANKFWWSGYTRSNDEEPPADEIPGMKTLLKEARSAPEQSDGWEAAVEAFAEADAEVRTLTAARQAAAAGIREHTRCVQVVTWTAERVRQSNTHCGQLTEAARQAEALRATSAQSLSDADQRIRDWMDCRPGFWALLMPFSRATRKWKKAYGEAMDARVAADREHQLHVGAAARLANELRQAQQNHAQLAAEHAAAELALTQVRAKVDAACARWPGVVPFGPAVASDEQLQLCAPWADPEFTSARTRLFLRALALHKAFLFATAEQTDVNLSAVVQLIQGKAQVGEGTALAAWQTLFLAVPVVSTTFASLPRLFSDLGSESLGWLFVDEAGQATPQQVTGGIWRCRRAVIVGDPLQLEPIVTLPVPAQHALRQYHGVTEQWSPESTSAQQVADRHARHGTWVPAPVGDGKVWVGAPLRVHRRCDYPMFRISNTVAYGGDLMIYGTPERPEFSGRNEWIDVRSDQAKDNWIPAEGTALIALLNALAGQGVAPRDVRVVSPFTDVVRGAKNCVADSFGDGFPEGNVGTVHTVQGQESDVVVLVLGSAPNRSGARQWAAEKPNLLNVAVSRAKRRFYVIGNRDRWKDLPHFAVLAAQLEAEEAVR
ncbi:DEAD/DEAH box helicase [Amycolatopsis sp. cg13]|uniref:DEAD/DEAH box helicase n=1 Tax=Amycolatopsis sp. cg13 TaxID=3238807 RepID=UPI00352671AA